MNLSVTSFSPTDECISGPDAIVPLHPSNTPSEQAHESDQRLSYKFQRLREKLREAISSGELSGRLPGERKLARKFRVNAKTLSKALTDLAAEGLLDRSIGRGTFVKGAFDTAAPAAERWLIVCEPHQVNWPVVQHILQANPEAQCVVGLPPQRPSFLNSFTGIIIFSLIVPDSFVRDLVVRNVPVVVAGRAPGAYSTHAVQIDQSHGGAISARDLVLAGHRRLAVVERRGDVELSSAVRRSATRYAPDATVDVIFAKDVPAAVQQGVTAIICESAETADNVRVSLDALGLAVPAQISVVVVGSDDGESRHSGYYVSSDQFGRAVIDLLRNNSAKRPVALFLAGQTIDRGTSGTAGLVVPSPSLMNYAV